MESSIYPTLYDETHISVDFSNPSIMSMANCQSLVGQLEHHAPTSDGSFQVCIAGGRGIFIKKGLFDSIPAQHRPALDTSTAGQSVAVMIGNPLQTVGTALLPFLIPKTSGEKVRIVVRVIVVQDLLMGMFIGTGFGSRKEDIVVGAAYGGQSVTFKFKTQEPGQTFDVKGVVP